MAAAIVSFVVVITTFGLSFTSACVQLECVAPSTTLAPWTFGDIHNWLVIFAIVVACIVALLLLIMLIWLTCWCCYRCTADKAPTIVKRIVVLRRRQEALPQQKINFEVVPTPPPVLVHQPTEKIIVVQPPQVQPQSLLLTVTDHNQTNSGLTMTTLVERPLTFTITPEYGNHQRDLSVYEGRPFMNDYTPGSVISGCRR